MLPRARYGWVAVLAATSLLGACASTPDGTEGDCNARIRFEGAVYSPHSSARRAVATELRRSGAGDVVGCDLETIDQVAVHAIRGVDPAIAVAVVGREWDGVYVLDGTRPRDWPARIVARARRPG